MTTFNVPEPDDDDGEPLAPDVEPHDEDLPGIDVRSPEGQERVEDLVDEAGDPGPS